MQAIETFIIQCDYLKVWPSNKCLLPSIYNCCFDCCLCLLTFLYFLNKNKHSFYTPLFIANQVVNQLPRLSARWVPGIPRGLHCGQPAPRQTTAPMAGKSPQPSHEPPFQAPVTLMKQWKEEKQGWEGGKTLNELLHRPLHKCSMKNSQILAVYKATTNHVSLHLWD